jgi:hypothetical protein
MGSSIYYVIIVSQYPYSVCSKITKLITLQGGHMMAHKISVYMAFFREANIG